MYQAVKDFLKVDQQPDPKLVEWSHRNLLTPDIWKLEQLQFQNIFIPDEMMLGKPQNSLIAEFGREGMVPTHPSCFTLEKFTFFKKDLGVASYPIAMEKGWNPEDYHRVKPVPAKIKGQLYTIFSQGIKKLDIHRQNTLQFKRIRTDISLPFHHVSYSTERPLPKISRPYLRTVEAWMYVGIPEYWGSRIGDLFGITECNHFEYNEPDQKFWVDRYYKFE